MYATMKPAKTYWYSAICDTCGFSDMVEGGTGIFLDEKGRRWHLTNGDIQWPASFSLVCPSCSNPEGVDCAKCDGSGYITLFTSKEKCQCNP